MKTDLAIYLDAVNPKICAFSYVLPDGTPIVCQMGFAIFENELIFHTNTWTEKWNKLSDGQQVALCIGFDHLTNYWQLRGEIRKVPFEDERFATLEDIYFKSHPDAKRYIKGDEQGIFLIHPVKVKEGIVNDATVIFKELE